MQRLLLDRRGFGRTCRGRQQHAGGGGQDQHEADDVVDARPFPQHQHGGERHPPPGRSARRATPSSPAAAARSRTTAGRRTRTRPCRQRPCAEQAARMHRPPMRRSFEHQQAGDGDHERDEQLPRRDRDRVGVDPRPFQIDRAGRPGHRRRQREGEAEQVIRSEQGIDQHRQSRGTQQERASPGRRSTVPAGSDMPAAPPRSASCR